MKKSFQTNILLAKKNNLWQATSCGNKIQSENIEDSAINLHLTKYSPNQLLFYCLINLIITTTINRTYKAQSKNSPLVDCFREINWAATKQQPSKSTTSDPSPKMFFLFCRSTKSWKQSLAWQHERRTHRKQTIEFALIIRMNLI